MSQRPRPAAGYSTTVWLPGDTQAACADAGAGRLQVGATVYRASGLSVQVDTWAASAQVMAATKPEGLMSGCWAGPSPLA